MARIRVWEASWRVWISKPSRPREEEEVADVQVASLQNMAGEAPIVILVNSIFAQAVREGASDVHVSPQKNSIQVRFRIDGKLHEVPSPPKTLFWPIVARIKILANMDITVTRVPQDGRFTLKMENKEINVRVSSIPTIHGENIVLRLLDTSSGIYALDLLGMVNSDIEKVKVHHTETLRDDINYGTYGMREKHKPIFCFE